MSALNIIKISESDNGFKVSFTFEDYYGVKLLNYICSGLICKRYLLEQIQEKYKYYVIGKAFMDAFNNLFPQIPQFPLVIAYDFVSKKFAVTALEAEDAEKLQDLRNK